MFRKIFSDVCLCSWKYHFLLVAHIFSVTKWIHNIIHSSKHKQNPEKKSSNPDKWRRDRDRDLDRRYHDRRDRDLDRRDRDHTKRRSARCLDRSLSLSLSLRLFVECVLFAECVSLFCACYGKCLKVKRFHKMISGSTSANFGQTEIIFQKIYFS